MKVKTFAHQLYSVSMLVFFSTSSLAAGSCFTLVGAGNCGVAETGSTLNCANGSGPSFVRVAPAIYQCQNALQGTMGMKRCNNTGTTVNEELMTYGCDASGNYVMTGSSVLQTCNSASLGGAECTSTEGEPLPMSGQQLDKVLSGFGHSKN